MQPQAGYVGRLTRLLLIGATVSAWAGAVAWVSSVHAASGTAPPAAPVVSVRTGYSAAESAAELSQVATAAQVAADSGNPRDLVFTADRSVFSTVGAYGDCTGRAPLTHETAAIDMCVTTLRYFIGHNPGVFTGLLKIGVGSTLGYYDGTGRLHVYQIVAVRTWLRSSGVPPPVSQGVTAQFQTCVTPDGSVDRILDAVEA